MYHRYLQPDPAIAACVRTILVLENKPVGSSGDEPLLPDGMPALIFRREQKRGSGPAHQLILTRQSSFKEELGKQHDLTLVAFFFKPFTLSVIFDVAASVLAEQTVDLWKEASLQNLNEQLQSVETAEQQVAMLSAFISGHFREQEEKYRIIQYATDYIMLNPMADLLMSIPQHFKISIRTFQRMFKKHVGITPNQYRRLCQFHSGFQQLRQKSFGKLSDIAYENGYADQSHYVRAFREYTHLTPKVYLKHGLNSGK